MRIQPNENPFSAPSERTRRALVFASELIALLQVFAIASTGLGIRLQRQSCLGIVVLAACVAMAADWISRPRGTAEQTVAPGDALQAAPRLLPSALGRLTLVVFILLMVVFAFASWRRGDLSYDGNAYHTLAANQWAVNGRISEIDPGFEVSPFANGYPKGAEAVAFVLSEAFGCNMAGILNFAFAPLGLLGVALLCQTFGAGWRDAFVLGAWFLLVPVNIYQYGSSHVDSAFASAVIALFALLAFDLAQPGARPGGMLAAGCAAGSALAIKSTGPLLVAVGVLGYLIASYQIDKRLPPGESSSDRFFGPLTRAAVCIALGMAIGGYWYGRNLLLHGNPLYPAAVALAGHNILPGIPLATIFKDDIPPPLRRLHPLLRLPISWLIPLFRAKAWDHEVELGSLGAFWILACVPAIAYCLRSLRGHRLSDRQRIAYIFLAASVAVCLLGTPLSFRSRFTVWLFALGMPSVVIALRMPHSPDGRHHLLRPWIVICGALLVAHALILGGAEVIPLVRYVPGWALAERFALRERPLLPLYPEMNSRGLAFVLERGGAIAVGPEPELGDARRIYGQLSIPLGRHNLIPLPASAGASEIETLHAGAGLEYVLWLSSRPVPDAVAERAEVLDRGTPFTLLRLAADKETTGLRAGGPAAPDEAAQIVSRNPVRESATLPNRTRPR
jgi:hypothetical protein